MVLSVIVLGLAANTLTAMRTLYNGDGYYGGYYDSYYGYYYNDYYDGTSPGLIRSSSMGLVVFVVSRFRVESLLRTLFIDNCIIRQSSLF